MQSVGVIHQLTRYPVKVMQGEALPSAATDSSRFRGGPRYAFVQATSRKFVSLAHRARVPELLYYRTSVEKAGTRIAVTVATAHGENWPLRATTSRKVLEQDRGGPLFAA